MDNVGLVIITNGGTHAYAYEPLEQYILKESLHYFKGGGLFFGG